MLSREEALTLLDANGVKDHLLQHCMASESVMKGLAEKFGEICQRELSLKECRALDGERICDNQQHWDDDEDGNPGDIGIGHRTELFHMLTPSS